MKTIKIIIVLCLCTYIAQAQQIVTNYISNPYIKAENLMTNSALIREKHMELLKNSGLDGSGFKGNYYSNNAYYTISNYKSLILISYKPKSLENFDAFFEGMVASLGGEDSYKESMYKEKFKYKGSDCAFCFNKNSVLSAYIVISNPSKNKAVSVWCTVLLNDVDKANFIRDFIKKTVFK